MSKPFFFLCTPRLRAITFDRSVSLSPPPWSISNVNSRTPKAMSKADVKLALIPLIFVLLRIWGTIDFFWSITREEKPIWIQILQVGIHVLDCAFPPFVSHPESLGSPFFLLLFFFHFLFSGNWGLCTGVCQLHPFLRVHREGQGEVYLMPSEWQAEGGDGGRGEAQGDRSSPA